MVVVVTAVVAAEAVAVEVYKLKHVKKEQNNNCHSLFKLKKIFHKHLTIDKLHF
jgi:hypothetical protein